MYRGSSVMKCLVIGAKRLMLYGVKITSSPNPPLNDANRR